MGPNEAPGSRMVSYAQNAEDVVLARVFAGQTTGFYIDAGANHPVDDSVTKHFYDLGWCGINIEPVAVLHAELARQRPRDINLCLALGDQVGELEFSEVTANPGLSTFNAELNRRNEASGLDTVQRKVPIRTLADVCGEYVTGEIDFLKVDVEGLEGQVFRGNDWQQFRPKVVVAEDNYSADWHALVEAQGYTQMLHDGLNRFYLRDDLRDALGPRMRRPAVHAIDDYDPWYYVAQLRAATAAIEDARAGRVVVGRLRRLARTRAGRAVRRIIRR